MEVDVEYLLRLIHEYARARETNVLADENRIYNNLKSTLTQIHRHITLCKEEHEEINKLLYKLVGYDLIHLCRNDYDNTLNIDRIAEFVKEINANSKR